MKKILILCLLIIRIPYTKAQFFSYPLIERSLELFSEPIIVADNLNVGDEGYIVFQVRNSDSKPYRGPIFLRIFEKEHSYQILVQNNVKLNPGKIYEFTTVFSTERLAPFVRYFVIFEYIENKHLIHINNFRNRPMPSFILHAPIKNRPSVKTSVRPGSRIIKESITKRSPVPINITPTRQNRNTNQHLNSSGNNVRNSNPYTPNSQRNRSTNASISSSDR